MNGLKVVFIGLLLILTTALSPDVGRIATCYGYHSWEGTVKERYSGTLRSYKFPPLVLATNNVEVRTEEFKRGGFERLTVYSTTNQSDNLKIEILTRPSVRAVDESLIQWFADCSMDYSSNTNDIGDRGYGIQHKNSGFNIFVRNNIMVVVSSTLSDCPAESVARQIDADILRKSRKCRWVRWMVGGLILLGLFPCAARRRQARLGRTDVSSGGSGGTKKEVRRKPGIVRVVLGFAVLLAFAVVVYSSWGRRMIERLVFEVGRKMAENSWLTKSRN